MAAATTRSCRHRNPDDASQARERADGRPAISQSSRWAASMSPAAKAMKSPQSYPIERVTAIGCRR